jgi:hypothetical protein
MNQETNIQTNHKLYIYIRKIDQKRTKEKLADWEAISVPLESLHIIFQTISVMTPKFGSYNHEVSVMV